MKKWRFEYTQEFEVSPLSFWVHEAVGELHWNRSTQFDPPLPKVIGGKGFARIYFNILGVELVFSSVKEVEHFLEIIKQKNMPTPLQLTKDNIGLNNHWLSRLPTKLLPWVKREKYIKTIESGLEEYKQIYQ